MVGGGGGREQVGGARVNEFVYKKFKLKKKIFFGWGGGGGAGIGRGGG